MALDVNLENKIMVSIARSVCDCSHLEAPWFELSWMIFG